MTGVTRESSSDWPECATGSSITVAALGRCGSTGASTSRLEMESMPITISATISGTCTVASTERLGDSAFFSAGIALLVRVSEVFLYSCFSHPMLQGSSATGIVLHKLIVQFW